MSYKDTNITNPGTSIKYGADDMEIIARLLNGTTSGPHPVTIKSTNKWGFWDNIMFVRNQADTFSTTIRGAATMTNNFTLALPNQTANDTLPAIGLTNVWGVKQQMEQGLTLKQQSSPSNPASTYHHLFMNSSQHLIRRNSSGVEVDYDNQIFNGSASVLKDYSARVFKTGSTYFAYDNLGNILSQGSVFETVAQAALNQRGSVLFAGPSLTPSGSFTGLDVLDKTHVVIERGCTIDVPQGYTGHFMLIEDMDKVIIELNGLVTEAGTPARNWNCFVFSSGTMPVMNSHIMHAHVANANNAVWLSADGASAKIMTNSFNHITTENCRKGVLFQIANGGTIDMNMFMDCMITPLLGTTTHGFKDVSGMMNEFHGCMVMDNDGTVVEMNILNSADNTLLIGGNIGMLGGSTFVDQSLTTAYFNAALQLKLDSGFFKMRTPAGNFTTTISNPVQTGNFEVAIPSLTANDTFATKGLAQTFTGRQTLSVDGAEDALDVRRTDNSVGNGVNLNFQLQDSLGGNINYGRIQGNIFDPTNNSEDGRMFFYVRIADVLSNVLTLDETGKTRLGGPNTRVVLSEAGLTGVHTYTFPDADTLLVGSTSPTLTPSVLIQGSGTSDFIYMYRTENAALTSLDLNFDLNSSTSVRRTYADVRTHIIDNTNASEDGRLTLEVIKAGAKVEMLRLENSITSIVNDITAANGTNTELDFMARDSGTNLNVYAAIRSEAVDITNGSEDGRLEFLTQLNGTLAEHMLLDSGGLSVTTGGVFATRDASSTLLDLYRTDNATNNQVDINFYLEDSTNAKTLYAKMSGAIVSNTNGSEDGRLEFHVRTDDVLTERMTLNDTGLLNIFLKSTQAVGLSLYRDGNTASNTSGITFDLEDSAGNRTTYGEIYGEILSNTNGAETGIVAIATMRSGTMSPSLVLFPDGNAEIRVASTKDDALDLYKPTSTNNEILDLNFVMHNSLSAKYTYGDFRCTILESSDAAGEDGRFSWNVSYGGTKMEMMALRKGALYVGEDASGLNTVPRIYTKSGSQVLFNTTSAEQTMFTQNVHGGALGGANGYIHLHMAGVITQNQATATNFTIRIKWGGTTYYDDVFGTNIPQSATSFPYVLDLYIMNRGGTSTQTLFGTMFVNDQSGTTTGIGDLGDDEGFSGGSFAATGLNKDTTSSNTLAVTFQASVSSASVQYTAEQRIFTLGTN